MTHRQMLDFTVVVAEKSCKAFLGQKTLALLGSIGFSHGVQDSMM